MIEQRVQSYRADHPAAANWARGSHRVRHSLETQDRIFRMAEQIRVNQVETNAARFFSTLKALDAVVDSETLDNTRPSPSSAAAAGLVGFKLLFGKFPPIHDHDWPEGFARVAEGEASLAALGLQAQGFEPIIIDGIDPTAYLWGLYEMHERQAACAEMIRLPQYPAAEPHCLAVIPEDAIRRPSSQTSPAEQSRELVPAGR